LHYKLLFCNIRLLYTGPLIMIGKRLTVLLFLIFMALPGLLHAQNDPKKDAQDLVILADEVMSANLAPTIALQYYSNAADIDPENLRANYMAGTMYLRLLNRDRSVKYLQQTYALDPQYKFNLLYQIGRGYQYAEQFDSAIYFYQRYMNKLQKEYRYRGSDRVTETDVNRRINECENGKIYVANPIDYSIKSLGSKINSDNIDYAPVINADATMLIFTSRRQDNNLNADVDTDNFHFEDIFVSRKVNGQWQSAKNIGEPVNTRFHDSNLALSADGNSLYLYKDDGAGNIYQADLQEDGTWSEPSPLNVFINTAYAEKSISVGPNKDIIFFSSNRPGGIGGIDIYYAKRNRNGTDWGEAVNMGAVINTEYDEEYPYIDFDGRTLYFSSKGRNGMGGYDIYKTQYDSSINKWTEPVNLGYPINTPDDDVSFIPTPGGQKGYYASVRDDGQGFTDIYEVAIPPDVRNLEKLTRLREKVEGGEEVVETPEEQEPTPDNTEPIVVVTDPPEDTKPEETQPEETAPVVVPNNPQPVVDTPEKNVPANNLPDNTPQADPTVDTQAPLPGGLRPVVLLIRVVDYDTGEPINPQIGLRNKDDNVVVGRQQVANGIYRFEVTNPKEDEYLLSIERQGYIFKNFALDLPGATPEGLEIRRQVELQKLQLKYSSVLRNIYFEFGKSTFTKESFFELNKLERFMAVNAGMVVEIQGHTDAVGPADYNKRLSQLRAQAVVKWLVDRGVDPRRLKAVGFGEEKPLASNDDELVGRTLNRRVEFKILKVN